MLIINRHNLFKVKYYILKIEFTKLHITIDSDLKELSELYVLN